MPKPPDNLIPLTEFPEVGDIVYEDNQGVVKYRVTDQYDPRGDYPDSITLEVVEDYGNGYFKSGHLSLRNLSELIKEKT